MTESNLPKNDPFTGKPLKEASPAATVVIFREQPGDQPPHILMVERSSKMAFAAGAAVFPGGRVDEADFDYAKHLGFEDVDEYGARIAAIREAIEETGIAVGIEGTVTENQLKEARHALNEERRPLSELCEKFGWKLDLEALIPFARWRPPFNEKRIFDTRFYIIADDDDSIEAIVDQTENYHLFWDSAQGVLDKHEAGEVSVIFPTKRNLERLAQLNDLEETRNHAEQFPSELVVPFVEERDGKPHLCIPEGRGYPVTAEAMNTVMRGSKPVK
ncbi:MAG: NUDIX domain-containing protein [Parasphingorhabdus sp.]